MSGLQMKYFVLKPKGADIYARASRRAMRSYAALIQQENPEFAKDLRDWADNEMAEAINIDNHSMSVIDELRYEEGYSKASSGDADRG